jgi:hypothetical protein
VLSRLLIVDTEIQVRRDVVFVSTKRRLISLIFTGPYRRCAYKCNRLRENLPDRSDQAFSQRDDNVGGVKQFLSTLRRPLAEKSAISLSLMVRLFQPRARL